MTVVLRAEDVPAVSVEQMREVDRVMVEELGIELQQMMENAGRALALRARVMLGGDAAGVPILALDMPCGLDSDRGVRQDPCISAASTLTLALPKIGLLQRSAMPAVGELFLADISVPAVVYDRIGLRVAEIFARDDVVALR